MLKRVLEYAKPFRKTLILVSFLILMMALLNQIEPFITKAITDRIVLMRVRAYLPDWCFTA
jgi:ABC-type multidrug transport system fused ATPase/permease subunit